VDAREVSRQSLSWYTDPFKVYGEFQASHSLRMVGCGWNPSDWCVPEEFGKWQYGGIGFGQFCGGSNACKKAATAPDLRGEQAFAVHR
jgi:hypothetical protein